MAKTNDDLLNKIQRARDALDVIWQKTSSSKKKSKKTQLLLLELVEKMEALDAQKVKVIAARIQQRGKEYDAVARALDAASEQMEKDLASLSKLTETLKTIGAAIDLLMKFKPA